MKIPKSTKIIELDQTRPRVYSWKQIQSTVDLVKNWASAYPNKLIGIVATNSFDFAVAWLGLRQTSCVTVLINHKLPPSQLLHCLTTCDLVLTNTALTVNTKIPTLHISQCRNTKYVELEYLDPHRNSLILYTSGSTGIPKAVVYSWQDIEDHMAKSYKSCQGNIRTISPNPFFHLAGLFWLNHNINMGNHLFIMNQFDPKLMLSAIGQYQIQAITAVPPIMEKLLIDAPVGQTFASVFAVNLPSAPLNSVNIDQLKKYFPAITQFKNPYGLTETGVPVFADHAVLPTPAGSTGVAGNLELQLIDSVLYIKTKHLKSQLKNNKEEWFSTGDRFEIDQNGFYYYLGRDDNMFKVNGEKVYPEPIESVIQQLIPTNQICVVGITDLIKGHVPVALIQTTKVLDHGRLLDHCRQHLAPYEIPVKFIFVEQFPLTASGKIDRTQLQTYIKDYVNPTY
jgi:long-chain acyl-CoA synthetase